MKITHKLGIPKQEFRDMYPFADHDIFYRDPKSDLELSERFLTNKLWRLNNLYTIVDKFGNIIPFIMNMSQHKVYLLSGCYLSLMTLYLRNILI